MHKNKNAQR